MHLPFDFQRKVVKTCAVAAAAEDAAAKVPGKVTVFNNPSLLHIILKAAAVNAANITSVKSGRHDESLVISRASLVCKQWRRVVEE